MDKRESRGITRMRGECVVGYTVSSRKTVVCWMQRKKGKTAQAFPVRIQINPQPITQRQKWAFYEPNQNN